MSNSVRTACSILILGAFCFTSVIAQQVPRNFNSTQPLVPSIGNGTSAQQNPAAPTAAEHCASVRTRISALQKYQTSYQKRFSLREKRSVEELIGALENDLANLCNGSSRVRAESSGVARAHAVYRSAPISLPAPPPIASRPAHAVVANLLQPLAEPSPTPSIDEQIKEMDEQIKLLAKKKELEAAQKALRDAVAANSEDVSDLQKETDLLTKRKAEVDAQKALLQSIFPSGTPKTIEGKITGSEALTLENQIIAYEAVDNITNGIGEQVLDAIPDAGNSRIIIHNAADLNSIVQYITLMNQLKQGIKVYDDLLKPRIVLPGESGSSALASALMAPQLASSVLSSVIDLISMFRTDTEFKATAVNIDNQALIGHVAKSLLAQKKNIQIYYPEIVPANILFMDDGDTLDIIEQLNTLLEKKSVAAQKVAEYEAQDDAHKKTNGLRLAIPKLKALNDQVDKINADLLRADDKGQTTPLNTLIKAERLKKAGHSANSYVLYVKALNSTGTTKLTKNLFTGSKMYHSGGAVISFILFDHQGAIVKSNTLHDYKGFIKVKSHEGTLHSNVPSSTSNGK